MVLLLLEKNKSSINKIVTPDTKHHLERQKNQPEIKDQTKKYEGFG